MRDRFPLVCVTLETLAALDMSDMELDRILRRSVRKLLLDPLTERRAAAGAKAQALVLNAVAEKPGRSPTQVVGALTLQKGAGLRAVRELREEGKLRAVTSGRTTKLYPQA